eukprot:gene8141-biopygen21126
MTGRPFATLPIVRHAQRPPVSVPLHAGQRPPRAPMGEAAPRPPTARPAPAAVKWRLHLHVGNDPAHLRLWQNPSKKGVSLLALVRTRPVAQRGGPAHQSELGTGVWLRPSAPSARTRWGGGLDARRRGADSVRQNPLRRNPEHPDPPPSFAAPTARCWPPLAPGDSSPPPAELRIGDRHGQLPARGERRPGHTLDFPAGAEITPSPVRTSSASGKIGTPARARALYKGQFCHLPPPTQPPPLAGFGPDWFIHSFILCTASPVRLWQKRQRAHPGTRPPLSPSVWEKRQWTWIGRGPHDKMQRNGRGPDAGSAVSPPVGRAGRDAAHRRRGDAGGPCGLRRHKGCKKEKSSWCVEGSWCMGKAVPLAAFKK